MKPPGKTRRNKRSRVESSAPGTVRVFEGGFGGGMWDGLGGSAPQNCFRNNVKSTEKVGNFFGNDVLVGIGVENVVEQRMVTENYVGSFRHT